ncbi:unnamed protein product [Linum tenue]|uniref:KIB1-4 beta-propeller domain-containing protein n=1 Tax=Linum tenue TaxID=586396 RepID=A0AAV0RFW3_9ROSI|nr:unnamed protein product [Linum tenue]
MELYRADLESKFIEKVESLPEDCAIFLCHYGARSFFYKIIPTRGDDDDDERTGIRGNTIYFTKTIGDRYLYAYDVRERSVSVSLPCPNVKRFYDPPGWILPAASLSSYKEETTSSSSPSDEEENFPVRPSNLKYRCCYHKKFKHHQHGFPILIHKGQDAERLNLIDPTTTNSVGTLALPGSTLTGAVIRCSNHGWLLMTQGSFGGEIFFFNPFTKEKIVLPGLGIYEFEGITFSSPPTSSDCTVFGYSVSSHAVSVTFIRRGQRRWTDSMVERKTGVLRNSLSNPVYHQGKFYFMGTNGNLCIHDPKERETKLMDLPKKPCGSVRRTHLLVSRGRLVAVFVGYMGRFVRVFELYRGAMVWKEVRDLGEVTLFLSSTSSLAVATRRSGGNGATARMGDQQVFLDKVVGGKRSDEEMLIYSLATKRFHTLSRGYESDDWCDTKEYTNSAWIEPNFETHTKEELRWFDPAVRVEETAACPRPKSDQWYKQCVAVE